MFSFFKKPIQWQGAHLRNQTQYAMDNRTDEQIARDTAAEARSNRRQQVAAICLVDDLRTENTQCRERMGTHISILNREKNAK